MFCRNCGKELQPENLNCTSCGKVYTDGINFCQSCGAKTNPGAITCVVCGATLAKYKHPNAKSKIVAGILGIFLGGFGIHRFYLGFTGIGVIQILVTIFSCGIGYVWGFIEGILILTGNINKDARGIELTD